MVADFVAQVLDAHTSEGLRDERFDLGLRVPVAARRIRHVVPHRRRDDLLLDVLEQHADSLADRRELARGVDAEHRNLALLGLEQAQDVIEERRLSAAVRTQYDGALAALYDEVEPAQMHLRAVRIGVAHARDANDRLVLHRFAHGSTLDITPAPITSTAHAATQASSPVTSA